MSLKFLIMFLGMTAVIASPSSTSATMPVGQAKAAEDHHSNNPQDKGTIYNGTLFPAVKDGKYGFIDIHGQFVIPPSFTSAREFSEGLAAVYIGGESYLDTFDGSQYITSEGGKWGFIDRTGAIAIPPSLAL